MIRKLFKKKEEITFHNNSVMKHSNVVLFGKPGHGNAIKKERETTINETLKEFGK